MPPVHPSPGTDETGVDDLADEVQVLTSQGAADSVPGARNVAQKKPSLARRGSLPPARDIERFRPDRFSLSGPLMHVFISYRVTSDGTAADELWEALARLGQPGGAFAIPAGARGKACPFVQSQQEGGRCKVFLDRRCLLDGRDWEAGFVLALAHSLVVVPLLSWEAADGGSVGQMVSLSGEADREDNVLLEFILALALRGCERSSVHAIFPLLLGPRRDDGSFGEFPFENLSRLPATPSHLTNARAEEILNMLNVSDTVIHEMKTRSVRDTVQEVLRCQGCKMSSLDASRAWDQCGERVLALVLQEIGTLQSVPLAFESSRPCAAEMLQWLRECGLQQLTPVFTSSGLGSCEAVATISGQRVRELATAFAHSNPRASLKLTEDLFARFEISRDRLKRRDLRARSVRVRLDRFVDNRVSWAAAFSSTSAAEIAASSAQGQATVGILLLFHIYLFVGNVQPWFLWQGRERSVARWAQLVYLLEYLALIVGLSAFEVCGVVLQRPFAAKRAMQMSTLATAVLSLFAPAAEVAQVVEFYRYAPQVDPAL